MTPTRHRLGQEHFDALAAGGGDQTAVSALLAAERSWRLVQLRAVLDAIRAEPDATGPLPPVEAAWELLVVAEKHAPAEVASLLLHPQAGTWAGYALRRLRKSSSAATPLWVDLGYLHALAAAAAVRAGIDFQLRIPVREGFAILPTLGGAHLPARPAWDQAEVRAAAGAVTISAGGATVQVSPAAGEGWVPLPAAEAEAGGHTLSVTLDHLDPYRNLRTPTPPQRLSAAELERWRTLVAGAWALLVEACPSLALPIACGLTSLVPQPAAERFRTMSASAGDAFGSMIVSEPEDAPELAVTLVHEFQHIKLGGVLHLTPLHRAEPAQRLYAPWRDDPRPLGGLLQGVYAFVGIVEFWRAFRSVATGRDALLAQFEFARWRPQVTATLRMLRGLPELTEVGRRLIDGLAVTAAAWQREEVPAEASAVAAAAVADHRARWRLHHRRPDPTLVSELTTAWLAGDAPPRAAYREPAVVPDPGARRLDTRAALTLWRLTDPDGFARLREDPPAVGTQISGASEADLAYAAGDWDRARELYLAEVAADPGSVSAWAGLGLLPAAADDPAVRALWERPELVRAIYREAGATAGPGRALELARWVGQAI